MTRLVISLCVNVENTLNRVFVIWGKYPRFALWSKNNHTNIW